MQLYVFYTLVVPNPMSRALSEATLVMSMIVYPVSRRRPPQKRFGGISWLTGNHFRARKMALREKDALDNFLREANVLWAVCRSSSVEVMLEIVKLRWTPMFSIRTIWNPESGHEGINVTFWGHEEN